MLERLFHVFGVVLFNVVVRPDGELEFIADHHSGSLSAWTADEKHDATARV